MYSTATTAKAVDRGRLQLRARRLKAADRDAVIDMISAGFAGKGDLETALGDVTYDVMRTNVSIVVHEVTGHGRGNGEGHPVDGGNGEGRLVGTCINTDVRAANHRQGYGSFNRVLAFLAAIERPHLEKRIPREEGKFYSSMLGTAKHLR